MKPQPPIYPKPPSPSQKPKSMSEAWGDKKEELARAPSRCDQREDSSDEPKTSEDDLESTFTVQKETVARASTPERPPEVMKIAFVPAPPVKPRPSSTSEVYDPRVRQIEVLNVASSPAIMEVEKEIRAKIAENSVEVASGDTDFESVAQKTKSILKPASSTRRRVVSANKSQGLVAASIRDSLDLVGKKLDKPSKSVKWDKLYYNDSTIAEFGVDGRPVPVKESSKKRGRKSSPKQQAAVEKGAGKRSSKSAKSDKTEKTDAIARQTKISGYTSNAIVVPSPSSGPYLRTETPVIK